MFANRNRLNFYTYIGNVISRRLDNQPKNIFSRTNRFLIALQKYPITLKRLIFSPKQDTSKKKYNVNQM